MPNTSREIASMKENAYWEILELRVVNGQKCPVFYNGTLLMVGLFLSYSKLIKDDS